MRKWLVFPVWASIGLLVYACDDDSTGTHPQDASVPDTSPTTTATTPGTDASTPDTFVPMDSSPGPNPVIVVVTDATGVLQAAIDVYFNEPGGNVVKVTTGADGKASHVMLAGGSITVAQLVAAPILVGLGVPSMDVTSVLEVQPGDLIHVSAPASNGPIDYVGQITGQINAAPTGVDAGAGFDYFIDFGGCQANGSLASGALPNAFSYNLDKGCFDASGKANFLVVAEDAATFATVAYAPKSVTIADGGTMVANVATADWIVAGQKSVTYTGTANPALPSSSLEILFPLGALSFADQFSNPTFPTASPYVLPPAAFVPNVQATTTLSANGSESNVVQHVQRVAQATALTENLSLMLPRVHNATITGTLTPSVSWQQDAPLGSDAIGSTQLSSTHTPDGGQYYYVNWQLVYPAHSTTTTIAFPTMPPAIAAVASPDDPWGLNQHEFAISAQAPYAIGHLFPTVLLRPASFAAQVPPAVTFDLRTTSVQPGVQ